jgi:hypothetical protein
MVGHRETEGLGLESQNVSYKAMSPDSLGVHAAGSVYFVNERALSSPHNLQRFLIAVANGWNTTYADYDRTVPIVARSIEGKLSSALISRFLDAQRRYLRPFGTRFSELDIRRSRVLQSQLLQQRIIQEPIDFARAINYDILGEVHRMESKTFTRSEP